MRLLLFILLLAFSCGASSLGDDHSGIKYDIPAGFHSLKEVDPTGFDKMSEGFVKDNVALIAYLSKVDYATKTIVMNIQIFEEIEVEISDEKYVKEIAALFKKNNHGDYKGYKWNGFIRLDAAVPKATYFIQTINGRQIVVITNHKTEKAPEIIELAVMKIAVDQKAANNS